MSVQWDFSQRAVGLSQPIYKQPFRIASSQSVFDWLVLWFILRTQCQLERVLRLSYKRTWDVKRAETLWARARLPASAQSRDWACRQSWACTFLFAQIHIFSSKYQVVLTALKLWSSVDVSRIQSRIDACSNEKFLDCALKMWKNVKIMDTSRPQQSPWGLAEAEGLGTPAKISTRRKEEPLSSQIFPCNTIERKHKKIKMSREQSSQAAITCSDISCKLETAVFGLAQHCPAGIHALHQWEYSVHSELHVSALA